MSLPASSLELTVGSLYPCLMSTYGDRGNVTCVERRAAWRGVRVRVVDLDEKAPPERWREADLLLAGGAQDRQQALVMADLQGEKARALRESVEGGVPGLFVCGAMQLLGHHYEPAAGAVIAGLGLLDLVTRHPGPEEPRCVGDVAIEIGDSRLAHSLSASMGKPPLLIGFENHGGHTFLGDVAPLGKVVRGKGNNGRDGTEGALFRNVVATYAHGPLLPRNPFLADWLIKTALERKYQAEVELPAVDDSAAMASRQAMLGRLGL